MKNVEIYFYVAEKAFFLKEILEKSPILADFGRFGPIFVRFWPLIYTPRDYLWLFMLLKAS